MSLGPGELFATARITRRRFYRRSPSPPASRSAWRLARGAANAAVVPAPTAAAPPVWYAGPVTQPAAAGAAPVGAVRAPYGAGGCNRRGGSSPACWGFAYVPAAASAVRPTNPTPGADQGARGPAGQRWGRPAGKQMGSRSNPAFRFAFASSTAYRRCGEATSCTSSRPTPGRSTGPSISVRRRSAPSSSSATFNPRTARAHLVVK